MGTLIDIVKNKFLEALTTSAPGKWKVLIVDEHSQRLLGAHMKQNDVLAQKVTAIDLITQHREPEPNMEAVYLLMPTTQNIDRIAKDFAGRPKYAGVWLHFTDRLPEKLLNRLGSSSAEQYLRGLTDLYINFWAIEAQAFSLYAPSLFFSMFSPPRSPSIQRAARERLQEDLRFAARTIANICIQLNENPIVRYYLPSHHPAVGPLAGSSKSTAPQEGSGRWREALGVGPKVDTSNEDHLSKLLAFCVQEELDAYSRANPGWPDTTRPQSLMLITDRTMDMIAPFVHEFTYQAMCNDLLPISNGTKFRYKFQSSTGAKEDKVATIAETDSLWVDIRHLHMKEAIDKLMLGFNEFIEQNASFKGEGAASLNDMKDMLASLPQYQEGKEQFSLHLNMAQQCMDLFEKNKLTLTANVEQNCATGLTAEGKTPKTLVEDMVPLLADSVISNFDKARIIALYILQRDGVPEEDRRRLYEHAKLTRQERTSIDNLVHMAVRVTRAAGERDTRKKIKNRPADDEYDLSRFKPLIKILLEDLAAGKLDATVFPYVKEEAAPANTPKAAAAAPSPAVTSLRNKPVWTKGARPLGGRGQENRQRILVFIAGGMTYSEIRTVYELSNSLGKDIFIGSTHSITPEEFLKDLQFLNVGGQGSGSIPNGLPDGIGTQQRPFQVYYDQKYVTKDEPPPPPKTAPAPTPAPAPISAARSTTGLGIPGGGLPERRPSPAPAPAATSTSSVPTTEVEKEKAEKHDKLRKKRFLGF